MTDEEKKFLRGEKASCFVSLKLVKQQLDKVTLARDGLLNMYEELKKEYEGIDMKLALEDKLTIVGRGRKSSVVDSLENILKDKEKVKQLMTLLSEEMKAEPLVPKNALTN